MTFITITPTAYRALLDLHCITITPTAYRALLDLHVPVLHLQVCHVLLPPPEFLLATAVAKTTLGIRGMQWEWEWEWELTPGPDSGGLYTHPSAGPDSGGL